MSSTQAQKRSTDPAQALVALSEATVAFADGTADSTQTLRLALDLLIRVTGADAGAIAAPGEEEGLPRLLAEHSLEDAGPISMTVLAAALEDRGSRATIDEPPASQSVIDAEITSILCVPVRRQGQTLAAVYLDRRSLPKFDEVALTLAVSFASMLALALDLTRKVEETQERAEEARAAAANAGGFWHFGEIVTHSRAFAECLQLAERLATSDITVLVLGATGSGKEHLARCIHGASRRRTGPFLAVNCAAIPEALIESELFGHEKGAFTGATEVRRGKFELAQGGTLLLDEIGELPLPLQPKLLRALDTKQVSRIGAAAEKQVDVRILAATHRDLAADVVAGRFREDLYYRLNVVTLKIPALAERLEDIAALATLFLEIESKKSGRSLSWDAAALRRLGQHSWPGNVRELKNLVERLSVLVEAPVVGVADLERHIGSVQGPGKPRRESKGSLRRRLESVEDQMDALLQSVEDLRAQSQRPVPPEPPGERSARAETEGESAGSEGTLRAATEEAARQAIVQAIAQSASLGEAARRLGISRQHLWNQCKRLGLRKALYSER